jgi:hypothetical protein
LPNLKQSGRGDVQVVSNQDKVVAVFGQSLEDVTREFQFRSVLDVRDFGYRVGMGDSVADTAAAQACLISAAGGTMLIPEITLLLEEELLYTANTLGPIRILGTGANSILKAVGVANKVLHVTGIPGVGVHLVSVEALQVQSGTSGVSPAGIHFDGIACFWLHDVIVDGKSKMTNGLQLSGAQQGEISGGYVTSCVTGMRMEPSAGIHSNGLDIHGVSMTNNSGASVVLDAVDSLFFRGNHLTGAPVHIDIIAGGFGFNVISSNHFESHTTAGVRSVVGAIISQNQFFTGGGGTDINLTTGSGFICGNLINGNVVLAGTNNSFIFNSIAGSGTFTDTSTDTTIKYGNRGNWGKAQTLGVSSLAYGPTVSTDAWLGNFFAITANNGTAFTISNPTNPGKGQSITYDIKNSSGGAMGAVTWGAAFKLAGAFVNPANTFRRTITFYYDGANWVETNRAAADI